MSGAFFRSAINEIATIVYDTTLPNPPAEGNQTLTPPPKKPERAPRNPHPAGERAGKRAGALAENLKKWLRGSRGQES